MDICLISLSICRIKPSPEFPHLQPPIQLAPRDSPCSTSQGKTFHSGLPAGSGCRRTQAITCLSFMLSSCFLRELAGKKPWYWSIFWRRWCITYIYILYIVCMYIYIYTHIFGGESGNRFVGWRDHPQKIYLGQCRMVSCNVFLQQNETGECLVFADKRGYLCLSTKIDILHPVLFLGRMMTNRRSMGF